MISIEPEPSNYELLVRNTRRFKKVRPIQAALRSHHVTLKIENPEGGTWSPRVAEAPGDGGVSAITIDDVLSEFTPLVASAS